MTDPTAVPTVTLATGVTMPQLGYGLWRVPADEAERAVTTALEAGYRSLDTAALYANEEGVGAAVARSGLPREELFLTTKVWNTDHGYDRTLRAFDTSMAKLGLDVLDLYLIHWPVPGRDLYVETWRALEQLYRDGRVRAIGVSNFTPTHLRRLFVECEVRPLVNQVELHPWFPQDELRAFHAEHQVVTEAYSPLGQGRGVLEEPVLAEIGRAHGVGPAQVVLRWHLQLGNVTIPKSVTPERIRSNLDVFGFELSAADMAQVSGLDRGTRLAPDPETFGG